MTYQELIEAIFVKNNQPAKEQAETCLSKLERLFPMYQGLLSDEERGFLLEGLELIFENTKAPRPQDLIEFLDSIDEEPFITVAESLSFSYFAGIGIEADEEIVNRIR